MPQNSEFFAISGRLLLISTVNCVEMIDQNNLRMKFSAINVNFSGLSPDAISSRRPAHASVKDRVSL